MSLTYPVAPTVAAGEAITSTQLAGLANAINARLRCGLGDGAERVAYLTRNAFLQLQNPSGSVYLPQSHFFTQRQMAEPEHTEWPEGEAGEDNGATTGSNWGAYVFGNDDIDLQPEAVRLTDPVEGFITTPASTSTLDLWQLGKLQRGAYDPTTGAIACPAFTAAREYSKIRWRWWSPQGASWGGYFASPALNVTPCEDPNASDGYPAPPNFNVFFTNLSTGATTSYPGTCSDGPDLSTPGMYDDHIYAWGDTPWAYYVMLNNGTVDELSKTEWIIGPFSGEPRLGRAWAGMFERFGHRFVGEFRGIEPNEKAMRARSTARYRLAPNFRDIVRRQYLLAPQNGTQSGNEITAIYQSASLGHGQSAMMNAASGMVFAGMLVTGSGSVTATDSDGDVVGSASGPASVAAFDPTATSVTLTASDSSSGVQVELLELLPYTPGPWDVFMMFRVGGAVLA